MDINSLLSPSDSPAGTPAPQSQPQPPPQPALASSPSMLQSPSKRAIRQIPSRTPSGLSQQITSSPQSHPALQQIPSPGFTHIANGARGIHSAMSSPQPMASPHDTRITPPHHALRQASTPGMDTLAGTCPAPPGGAWPRDHGSPYANLPPTAMADEVCTNWLVDLASMQQQQTARQNSVGQRPVT